MGIGNTFATIPGIVSPILTGHLVSNETVEEWRTVFFISAGIYLFGCVVYWFWCSGELQEWAKVPTEDSEMSVEKGKTNGEKGYVNEAVDLKE